MKPRPTIIKFVGFEKYEKWDDERWLWIAWMKNEQCLLYNLPKTVIKAIAVFVRDSGFVD